MLSSSINEIFATFFWLCAEGSLIDTDTHYNTNNIQMHTRTHTYTHMHRHVYIQEDQFHIFSSGPPSLIYPTNDSQTS